jgi:hypothetical protein
MSLLPKKKAKFGAKVEGAGRQAANARSIGRMIDSGMADSARNVGDDAELIYQAAAPRRTGRLGQGIRAVPAGDSVVVTATAVDPKTGFDYVAVSRFGHRKRLIVPVTKAGRPRRARRTSRGLTGRFANRGRGALAFNSRGKRWVLPSVKGFRPRVDWVDTAWPEVSAAADTEMEQTGNEIAVRWSS